MGSSLSGMHYPNRVVVALVISTFFAVGLMLALLALVELQPVKDWFGIPDNLLERFPRNFLIKFQFLMFLIGVIYLLVRGRAARRPRAEMQRLVNVEHEKLRRAGDAASRQAASERIDALIARAEAAESASLAPLSFVVWVLPILGFLGTVVGVSNSMGPLEALAKGESAAKVAPDLLRNLRYPFDATFTGLVLLLPMMVFFTAASTRARRRIVELRASALGLGRRTADD